MSGYEITKAFEIAMAHRLVAHEGKCAKLHGHTYRIEVTCSALTLDACGRVVDFDVIKQKFGYWLDTFWDHATLLEATDPLVPLLAAEQQKVDTLPYPPTAENIARHLFTVACNVLQPPTRVERVRVYESRTSCAEWRRSGGR